MLKQRQIQFMLMSSAMVLDARAGLFYGGFVQAQHPQYADDELLLMESWEDLAIVSPLHPVTHSSVGCR